MAANALLRVSVKREWFQSISESGQRDVSWPQVVWPRIPHYGTMNGETTVAVTCPRAWNVNDLDVSEYNHTYDELIQRLKANIHQLTRDNLANFG